LVTLSFSVVTLVCFCTCYSVRLLSREIICLLNLNLMLGQLNKLVKWWHTLLTGSGSSRNICETPSLADKFSMQWKLWKFHRWWNMPISGGWCHFRSVLGVVYLWLHRVNVCTLNTSSSTYGFNNMWMYHYVVCAYIIFHWNFS